MLVGLMGKKQSGKSTLAGFMRDDYGFTVLPLAEPIREALLLLDPLVSLDGWCGAGSEHTRRLSSIVDAYGWDYCKERLSEVRRLMQVFGCEMAQTTFGPRVWLDKMLDDYAVLNELGRNVVVPDVRFPVEAQAILNRGGLLVKVERIGQADSGDTHASEVALDDALDPLEYVTVAAATGDVDKLWNEARVVVALALFKKRYPTYREFVAEDGVV